jgi:hypothetical protein
MAKEYPMADIALPLHRGLSRWGAVARAAFNAALEKPPVSRRKPAWSRP